MRTLKVEFAPKRQVPTSLWAALGIALGLLAVQQAWQAWTLQGQLRAAESEVATLSTQIDRAEQARRDAADQQRTEPLYARDAAAVAKLAGFPLARVLASLEQTRVPGVRLTALEIAAAEG